MTLNEEVREGIARMSGPPLVMDDWEEVADSLSLRFEWKGSKIDWEKTKNHKTQCLTGDRNDWVVMADEFIRKSSVEDIILNGDIFYINDSSLDFAVRVSSDQFYEFMSFMIRNVPQHHYFFDEKKMWCLVISAEGYIDFGISNRPKLSENAA